MPRFVPAAALAVTGLLAIAASAVGQSTTKSSSTNSCPSQNLVMTSDWYGATSTSAGSFLCSQEFHDGDMNVGTLDTSTFNPTTNVAYYPTYSCWSTTDDKAFSIAHAEIFGSGSVSATNWDDTNHHWGAGYLFTLGSGSVTGFTNGCKSTTSQVWEVPPSLLRISSISASGLPDAGASKAGVQYTINVTASPGDDASGYQAVLQDNGENVAVGTMDASGKTTFTWTPAEMGSRKIQVAWPGNSGTMGNITDKYTVNVSGGMAVKFDSAPVVDATTNGVSVTVDLDTSPDAFPTAGAVVLIDAATQASLAKAALPTVASGVTTASVPMAFVGTPGRAYKLVAQVRNAAGAVIGQSYMTPMAMPTVLTPTVPTSVYVKSVASDGSCADPVSIPVSVNPSTATGTVSFSSSAAPGSPSTATLSGGAATVSWCPPATAGTYSWTMSYPGNAAVGGATSTGTITVNSPAPTVSLGSISVTKKAPPGGSGTAQITVKATNAGSSTVNLVSSNMAGKLGSGTLSGGSATISFNYIGGTTYFLTGRLPMTGQAFVSDTKTWTGPSGGTTPGPTPQERVVRAAPTASRKPTLERAATRRRPAGTPGRTQPAAGEQPVNLGVTSMRRRVRVGARGSAVTLACPTGSSPLQGSGTSSGPATQFGLSFSGRRATITSPAANAGHRMTASLMCRANSAAPQVTGRMAFGTRRGDTLVTTLAQSVVLAGPGRDRVRATGAGSVAWGGFGPDRIVIARANSVAAGGHGHDRLLAVGPARMLLIGGPGRDLLVGGTGATYVNAADGQGDDRVVCRSSRNRVRVDVGDTTSGPCQIIAPAR